MSYIKFQNGVQLDAKQINQTNIFSKGAGREALEIILDGASYEFNEIYNVAANADNLGTLSIIDDGAEYVHPNYEIFHSLKFENDEFTLVIGQLTEQELKYNELLSRIEALEK